MNNMDTTEIQAQETEEKIDNLVKNCERLTGEILKKIDLICEIINQTDERLKKMLERLNDMLESNRRLRTAIVTTTADNIVTHLKYLRLKYNDLLKPPEDTTNGGKNE
jgi:DNA repair ATPase RecN